MAEVTQAPTGLSSLSSKKPPSFNCSSSSSSKHIYDDVFASPPQRNPKSSRVCSFVEDDYGEIFGSTKSDNGLWLSSGSTIPILPLGSLSQQESHVEGGEREINYCGVFGRFGDENFAVQGRKELFGQFMKKAKASSSAISPSEGQTAEPIRSRISKQSDCEQSNGFFHSFDNVEHKTGRPSNGATCAVDVHDTPESTSHFDEGSPFGEKQTSESPLVKDDTELGMDINLAEKQKKHSRNATLDLGADEQKNEHDGINVSNSFAASYGTSQYTTMDGPSKIVKDDAEVDFDVEVDASLTQTSNVDTDRKKSDHEAGFFRLSEFSGSSSVVISHDTSQVGGTSNMFIDQVQGATEFDVRKNKWRHSRVSSLDDGYHKQAQENDAVFYRKSRLGTSFSFDTSHDPFSAHLKVQSSKAVPSSSVPHFFPSEKNCEISENSRLESSGDYLYRDVGGSPPSLDEQLDVNSAAAASVAVLQRALQEAEIQIRLAKKFLEREGQSSLTFKDSLKEKVAKKNKHAHDSSKFQPLSLKDTLKAKVMEEDKRGNDVNKFQQREIHENHIELHCGLPSYPIPERLNVSGTAEFAAVFDGQNKAAESEDPEDGEGSKVSKLIEVGDKCEDGGEWETAKHLNEIFSGVKNKIASYMTWQTDTENKGEPKEIGNSTKSLEGVEPEMKDLAASEMEGAELDECASISANDTDYEENKATNDTDHEKNVGLMQEANDAKEEESTSYTNFEHDKISHDIGLISDVKGFVGESFLHFSFLNERSYILLDDEGEKKKAQESRELEFEKRQEAVENKVKYELVQGRGKEATPEAFNLSCAIQDCRNSKEDSDVIMEAAYSTAEHERKEFIHEEESSRRLNEQHGEESTDISHCPGSIEKNEIDVELEEYNVQKEVENQYVEEPVGNKCFPGNTTEIIENENVQEQVLKAAEFQEDATQLFEDANLVGEVGKGEMPGDIFEWKVSEGDQSMPNTVEDVVGKMPRCEENKSQSPINHTAEALEHASCVADDAQCRLTEKVFLGNDEEACQISLGNLGIEEAVFPDESGRTLEMHNSFSVPKIIMECPVVPDKGTEKIIEILNSSAEPKIDFAHPASIQKRSELIGEESVLSAASTESSAQFDVIACHDGTSGIFPSEVPILHYNVTNANCVQKDIEGERMESKSEEILKNQTDRLHAFGKTSVEEVKSAQEEVNCSVDAVHRRKRWFQNGDKIGAGEQPNILEGHRSNLETDQEALEECEITGSVETNSVKMDSKTTEASIARQTDAALNHEDRVNIQAVQKRRRWVFNTGAVGVPEPPNLLERIKVTSDLDPGIVNEPLLQTMSGSCIDKLNFESRYSRTALEADVVINDLKDKHSMEGAPRRKRWFENEEKGGPTEHLKMDKEAVLTGEENQAHKAWGDKQKCGTLHETPILEEKNGTKKDKDPDVVDKEEKEKEKERIAVDRAIREARERAFAEVRERARRDAVERTNMEAHQKAGGAAQDRTGKVYGEATSSCETKLRAERAAVERATAEARERALQKALSEKASNRLKEQDPKFHSSSSCSSNRAEKLDGESPQRRKARLERQSRIVERAAKALEEKNKRDLLSQNEEAIRNMLVGSLDAEVKQWSCGKEGNLRALLSTLQYILGPDSGWQIVSLTDLVAPAAVRKAYKKANLCVHPDKLQQRGATIHQKYICEKVFELLKDAWSKFNPDER